MSLGSGGARPRSEYLAFEAFVGARKLIEQIMCVQAGENVLITTDTSSDMRVAELLGGAAKAVGAHPVIVRYEARWQSAVEPPAPVPGRRSGPMYGLSCSWETSCIRTPSAPRWSEEPATSV